MRALLLQDCAGPARIRIEAEGEELGGESAKIDFSVDDGTGLVFVRERKRLRLLRRRLGIGRCRRGKPHVHVLVDGRGKRLERNGADLREFAVDSAGDARAAPAPRLEAQPRRQGGDGRKLIERRERIPLGGRRLDSYDLSLPRAALEPT